MAIKSLTSLTLLLSLFVLTAKVSAQSVESSVVGRRDSILFDIQPDAEEYAILKEIFNSTQGKKWKNKKGWLTGTTSEDFSGWYGVTVENGDVVALSLDNNGLVGEIPKSVYDLKRIRSLSFMDDKSYSNKTLKSPELFQPQIEIIPPTCAALVGQGKNLPVWVLTGPGSKDQKVDWRYLPAQTSNVVNSASSTLNRTGGLAIDDCGKLAFYLVHEGGNAPNQVSIYSASGTKLTSSVPALLGLSAAQTNSEIQVVRVPGKADEWYIIYSLYSSTSCAGSPTYCPARVVYAKVKYNVNTQLLTILSRDVDISSTITYAHGKAVSSTVNGDTAKHYLYLAERGAIGGATRFHRFIIDASGIHSRQQTPNTFPAQYWNLSISGSGLELSHDGNFLAFLNRNESTSATYEDIIVFDVRQFTNPTYTPFTLNVSKLLVTLDWGGTTITKSIQQLSTEAPYNSVYSCFNLIKSKLGKLEFSPSGRYLYIIGGGVTGSNYNTYQSYLGQIDLQSGGATPIKNIRLQIQQAYGSAGGCSGILLTEAGTNHRPLSMINSAYDGRLYFTKANQSKLFVIPQPDCIMPQNLTPFEVDLSTFQVPNIEFPSGQFVNILPEGIDGHQYQKESNVQSSFSIDKTAATPFDMFMLTINQYSSANTYIVNWGNGASQVLTSQNVQYWFAQQGNYTITLTTIDALGCSALAKRTILITDCIQLSNIAITYERLACALKFNVNQLNGCAVTYSWNFGDGNTASVKAPFHSYSSEGVYTVSLNLVYNCSSCVGDTTLTKSITIAPVVDLFEEVNLEVTAAQIPNVLSSSVATFSDAWLLQHGTSELSESNSFLNGTEGVWRNNATYVFDAPRSSSPTPNIKTDGTYTLNSFDWGNAEFDMIPGWIKANTMTQYSPYSYELENRDVMGIYSTALYDYGGHLPSANGSNMRNREMGFTSFEYLTGNVTGNFIFGTNPVEAYSIYEIAPSNKNVVVVKAPLSKLQGVAAVDVVGREYYNSLFGGGGNIGNTYRYQNDEVICVQPHPDTDEWCIIVLQDAPSTVWTGTIQINHEVLPVVNSVIDNTVAHSGKNSLKIQSGPKTYTQHILQPDSAKRYLISCWVSVNNKQPLTPLLASGLGIDVIVKRSNGTVTSTVSFEPSGAIIEGWQQVKGVFSCDINNAVIDLKFKQGGGGGIAWYDDLRLHPEKGNMKSYVYDLKDYRLRAILDEENFASFFYYDVEGNLYLTKKETVQGIKTLTENISYQKKEAQN